MFIKTLSGFRPAQVIHAANPALFSLEAFRKYGQLLHTMFTNAENCIYAACDLMAVKRFEDAAFCFDLGKVDYWLVQNPAVRDRYMAEFAYALLMSDERPRALEIVNAYLTEDPPERYWAEQALITINASEKNA